MFKHYKNKVENQLNKKIKIIRNDRGGEYEAPFDEFCLEHDIIHQTTAPYSPQSNGIAKCKNRTLKEMMNAMLISSGLRRSNSFCNPYSEQNTTQEKWCNSIWIMEIMKTIL